MGFRFFILPFVILVTIATAIWWYYSPGSGLLIMSLLLFSYGAAAWWLDTHRSDWWRFTSTPWLLASSILLFSLLLSRGWILVSLLIVMVLLEAIYWRYVVTYTDVTATYAPFSLERLSFNLNFVVVFFVSGALYGLRTFLDISLWIVTPIFAAVLALLIIQRLWITKQYGGIVWRLAISTWLSAVEIFLLTSFLPFDFRILAFIVTAVYYGLITLNSKDSETVKKINRFWLLLIILALTFIAVLATARWY